ncbi:MAG: hypothetical protein HOL43_08765 [Verrucomicrobiales bacterium]|nr:hypothetical protein [Verrucomicrobiales bacterium]
MYQRKKVRRTVPTSLGNTLADLSNRPATSGEALANRKNPFAALGEAVAAY